MLQFERHVLIDKALEGGLLVKQTTIVHLYLPELFLKLAPIMFIIFDGHSCILEVINLSSMGLDLVIHGAHSRIMRYNLSL